MTTKRNITALAALALAASACASTADTNISETSDADWTAEQQAAYDQCLQDNMAVATAWEMIEASCREQVSGDPLGMSVEE